MTRKSRVEYNAIAWVSEIQLCVRSVVLSFMARPSLAWRVTCALNVPHQYGQVLGVDLNRSGAGKAAGCASGSLVSLALLIGPGGAGLKNWTAPISGRGGSAVLLYFYFLADSLTISMISRETMPANCVAAPGRRSCASLRLCAVQRGSRRGRGCRKLSTTTRGATSRPGCGGRRAAAS